jgi:hypothetical protein
MLPPGTFSFSLMLDMALLKYANGAEGIGTLEKHRVLIGIYIHMQNRRLQSGKF